MLILTIDSKNEEPVYKQITSQVIELIQKGTLRDGDVLPSSRQLALQAGVNRTTVCKAYRELWAMGHVDSRPGSYSVVRARKDIVYKSEDRGVERFIWNDLLSDNTRRMLGGAISPADIDTIPLPASIINFSKLDVDTSLIPVDEIRKHLMKLVVPENTRLFLYEHPQGSLELRQGISDRLSLHGIEVSTDEILITQGSNQALDLILRTYLNPGDTVAIEAPSYQLMHYILRYYNANVIEITLLRTGIDLVAFEKAAQAQTIKFLYTIPSLQNPSGVSTSQEHREKLLEICEKYGILIIEDGYEEEMKYFGKIQLPIKSMDKHKQVFYISSLSKVFSPGLRVGWVVAHAQSLAAMIAHKRLTDITSNTMAQMLAAKLFHNKFIDAYVKRSNRVSKKRMLTATRAINEQIPAGLVSYQTPLGGYLLWLRINSAEAPAEGFADYLMRYGVAVSGGERFFWNKPPGNFIRLSLSLLTEEEIVEGIRRIGVGLANFKNKN
jgi:DNA-binding transcriptional MocR family regulator